MHNGLKVSPRGIFTEAFLQLRELRGRRLYSIFDPVHSWGVFRSAVALTGRCLEPLKGSKRRTELLLNLVLGNDTTPEVLQPLAEVIVKAAPSCLVGVVANVARSERRSVSCEREVWKREKKGVKMVKRCLKTIANPCLFILERSLKVLKVCIKEGAPQGTRMGGRREYLLYGRRYVRQSFQVLLDREMHSFVLQLGASSKLPLHSGASTCASWWPFRALGSMRELAEEVLKCPRHLFF